MDENRPGGMKMLNLKQNLKKIVCGCLLIAGCMASGISALAAQTGSIQISYRGRTDKETVVLSDTPFILYYAGSRSGGEWKLSEEFRDSGVSLKNPDSSERKKQAEKLYSYAVSERIKGTEQETDAAGLTRFDDLKEGLYLVAQTREIRKGDWIFRSSPFLVSVPGEEAGKIVWDVETEPKSGWTDVSPGGGSEEETEDEPDDTTEESLVETEEIKETEMFPLLPSIEKEEAKNAGGMKTGDSAVIGIWILLLIISACVTAFLYRRNMRLREAEDSETNDTENEQT